MAEGLVPLRSEQEHTGIAPEQVRSSMGASFDEALVAFANKLWRLYQSRTDMIIPSHYKLACRAIALLPWLSTPAQRDVALKLSCFVARGGADFLPQKQFLLAVHHAELIDQDTYRSVGNDPSFLLISDNLKCVSGKVKISFNAKVIEGELTGPCLYVDTGAGFYEDLRLVISDGPLADCEREIVIPAGARRLRFDPGSSPGRFQVSNFKIAPVQDVTRCDDVRQSASSAIFQLAKELSQKSSDSLPAIPINTVADLSALVEITKDLVEMATSMDRTLGESES